MRFSFVFLVLGFPFRIKNQQFLADHLFLELEEWNQSRFGTRRTVKNSTTHRRPYGMAPNVDSVLAEP